MVMEQLPVTMNHPDATKPKEPLPRPTLLIVDDEAGPRESLRIVFKDRYNCAVATCGREGIDYARANHVDAAILDIKMPDLSGVEVLRELKEIDPNIECIMLTGYETVETARAAVRYGAADYLNKPFDVFAMRELLEKCMTRRQRKVSTDARMVELQQTNESLRRELLEANRAVEASVLSAGVVHEMNNPLSIIAGYSDLLGRDLAKLAEPDSGAAQNVHQRLATIQREIERCKQIAKRFLMFSRGTSNSEELMEVRRIVDDAASLVKAHPANRGVEIQIDPIDEKLMVRVHPTDILQIFINLGVNALQAMDGRGKLRFSGVLADMVEGQLTLRGNGFASHIPHVKISVQDTGPGIPSDQVGKIFDPYFTTKETGTGLGLAIVSELVGKHRGALQVTSIVGEGTGFHVYLPLVQ
jgi:signal transduction histidine kinase